MNRPLETISHAIAGFSNDHNVTIEARTLAAAFGDEIASQICLRTVTLSEETDKFDAARRQAVEALRRDRGRVVAQAELGFDVGDQVSQVNQAIVDAQMGRTVILQAYPVTCGQLRFYIDRVQKSSVSTVVPNTVEIAEDPDESAF